MLKRVSIQNFKSLKDVTLDLQKVNLLIGPNNSGKSNFLKALEFCKNALEKENTYHYYLKHKQDLNNEILIQLIFESSESFRNEKYKHLLFIENSYDDHDFIIETSTELANTLEFDLDRDATKATIDDLKVYTGEIVIYKIDPNKLSQPFPIGSNEKYINSDASNLVGFLDLALGKYRKTVFNKIEYNLNFCISEFDEISLDDVKPNGQLKKIFGDKSFKRLGLTNSKQGITYWADELSEGTLYFLALLCIINQPDPPKLLLLEEPEKGIHPRRIWEIMRFIFQLAEEKDIQIILTTHNEHVVNAFAAMPEAVFVFDKDEEGATQVRNLQRDIIEESHRNRKSKEKGLEPINFTENLGDSWMYGLIGGVPSDEQ